MDGTTGTYDLPDDRDLLFDHPWQPHEHYRRTTDTITLAGKIAVSFEIDPQSPAV